MNIEVHTAAECARQHVKRGELDGFHVEMRSAAGAQQHVKRSVTEGHSQGARQRTSSCTCSRTRTTAYEERRAQLALCRDTLGSGRSAECAQQHVVREHLAACARQLNMCDSWGEKTCLTGCAQRRIQQPAHGR
ncbi:hypothetical protein AMTR_s00004p00270000 [Amborella trichopoda]|uniref:Uncharacterized protein n=1 Tax=Amborella trichopoda TaxID=13333 RepID=W1NDM4_AMBTC|nr:hypothetical protein AMTR_s00004p00270000 [Amborella trichopoda]